MSKLLEEWLSKPRIDKKNWDIFLKQRNTNNLFWKLIEEYDIFIETQICESYDKVLKHRKKCKLWGSGNFCLDCFGGGFTKFFRGIGIKLIPPIVSQSKEVDSR